MIRVTRIYEIALSPRKKGDTDKQVCPCHPFFFEFFADRNYRNRKVVFEDNFDWEESADTYAEGASGTRGLQGRGASGTYISL